MELMTAVWQSGSGPSVVELHRLSVGRGGGEERRRKERVISGVRISRRYLQPDCGPRPEV